MVRVIGVSGARAIEGQVRGDRGAPTCPLGHHVSRPCLPFPTTHIHTHTTATNREVAHLGFTFTSTLIFASNLLLCTLLPSWTYTHAIKSTYAQTHKQTRTHQEYLQ